MNPLWVMVCTPEGIERGQWARLSVRGLAGALTVLAGHAPLVTALAPGEVTLTRPDGTSRRGTLPGGLLSVTAQGATLLAPQVQWRA